MKLDYYFSQLKRISPRQLNNNMTQLKSWFIRRGKQIKGPYLETLIRQYLLLGRIRENDEVSTDKENWLPIAKHKTLFPDVMLENPRDKDKILAERIKLDERTRDRRDSKEDMGDERRKARDRRQQEPEDMVEYRERHARVMDSIVEAHKPLRNYRLFVIIPVVLIVLIGLGYLFQSSVDRDKPDCNAQPGPDINWNNCSKRGVNLANKNLSQANLKNSKLHQANFLGAVLTAADLSYAELTMAVLVNAELNGARLKGANLTGADLSYANLENADLSFADLTDAMIGGVNLNNAHLDNAIWCR